MSIRKIFFLALLLILAFGFEGCQLDKEEENLESSADLFQDNIIREYPIRIGNDQAMLRILNVFNKEKSTREFSIQLTKEGEEKLNKDIDVNTLFNLNETVSILDTTTSDYLIGSSIKEIIYSGIRSNTLYFKTELENMKANKKIKGRFNLFYRTNKKGKVYGWITDEIENLKN